MTLLTILLCFAFQHFLHWRKNIHFHWLDSYVQIAGVFLAKLNINNGLCIVLALLVPWIIIIALVNYLLKGWFFNLPQFFFNLLILFYCLDAYSYKHQLTSPLPLNTAATMPDAVHSRVDFLVDDAVNPISQTPRAITRRIFLEADWYVFSVIFWYILTGVVGVAIYAIITYFYTCGLRKNIQLPKICLKAASQLQFLLDWIPVRVTGLTYALMGHFNHAFLYWRTHLWGGLKRSPELAVNSGLAALECDTHPGVLAQADEPQRAVALIDKTIILWFVVIALFTLVSWVS